VTGVDGGFVTRLPALTGWPAARDPEAVARVLTALRLALDEEGADEVPLFAGQLVHRFFGYRLRTGRYGGPERLDLSFRLEIGTGAVVRWDDRTWFIGPAATWRVVPLFEAMIAAVAGDEAEIDYTLAGVHPLFPSSTFVFPDAWWDGWRDRPDVDGVSLREKYAEHVHPWVRRLLTPWLRGAGRSLRVIDLCGGEGDALRSVEDLLPGGSSAVVVDRNRTSLARVDARWDRLEQSVGEAPLEAADLILAVGALCVNVLSPPEAARAAGRIADALQPGGVAVVAGWTPCLLARADWEALGLTVVNCLRPAAPRAWEGQQLYGVQRRG
jgi:hypothetical protein